MKVKVSIYQQRSLGAPLQTIMDPVYGEIEKYEDLGQYLTTAIMNAESYIDNSSELTNLIETAGITRYLDIVNLQVSLLSQGLVLLVTQVTTDQSKLGVDGVALEIISPLVGMLPVSTSYYDESKNYDMVEIVDEIVTKFNLGDPGLVPQSTIKSLLASIKDMKSRGLDIFPMYIDQLTNELVNYGFSLYYVYL